MQIVTAEQMRRIEREAFASGRVAPDALMLRAGLAVAAHALAALAQPAEARALVLVGPGNNGGDGLVVAEALGDAGLDEVAVWLYRREGLQGAPVADDLLDRVVVVDAAAFGETLAEADLIVDAIYGIGARDALPPDLVAALEAVNARGRDPRVVCLALDVPTGVNADSGAMSAGAFRADLTVTLGRPKRGLFLPPGMRHAGRVIVEPIGLDAAAPADAPRLIAREDAAARLPRRAYDAHKGDAGSLLVVGGSANYLGAPVLAGDAALRAGVGLLTLAVPRALVTTAAARIPEATYLPLPEADWGVIGPNAAKTVTEALGRYTALQVGNGIGRDRETTAFLARLFGLASGGAPLGFQAGRVAGPAPDRPGGDISVPVLVDADGLSWLSTVAGWWDALRGLRLVLTPHQGEFARLRRMEREAVAAAPWDAARAAAREWGQVVVLKGGYTSVATPDGGLWVTPLANPALAAAGTGDTLAGIIGGLLAQGLEPADAAILGLYLGARAGELASAAVGTLPLRAGDLPDYVALAIQELE